MLVSRYYSSIVANHIDIFTYIFRLYSVLLEDVTIVYKICLLTITCRWNYGLFHYGCEANLTLGFLLTAALKCVLQ
jgi:hypothetical protein